MTRRRLGQSNPRGRLERDLGPFRLRDDLAVPGDLPLTDAVTEVLADWERQVACGNVSSSIVEHYAVTLTGLCQFAARHGVHRVEEVRLNHVLRWMSLPGRGGTAPTVGTLMFRRAAVRSFFGTLKVLGVTDANPAKSVEIPKGRDRCVNAFTDGEMQHLKDTSRLTLTDLRTPATLALMISGATGRESSYVTVADIDLHNRRVWVHDGGYRQRPRWVPLFDDWCVEQVTRRLNELDDSGPAAWFIYEPHSVAPTAQRQGQTGINRVVYLIKVARLHRPGITRPESIREWLAFKVFEETGAVEAVASRLGMASLDAAAHLVGYDWLEDFPENDTPPDHWAPPADEPDENARAAGGDGG